MSLGIFPLFRKHLFQNHERIHLPCAQLLHPKTTHSLPHQEVLHQRLALRRDVRLGTRRKRHAAARPNHRPGRFAQPQPTAIPFRFQAGPPARVALPTGLMGKLKMEGD
jgi:hypothetical protein